MCVPTSGSVCVPLTMVQGLLLLRAILAALVSVFRLLFDRQTDVCLVSTYADQALKVVL